MKKIYKNPTILVVNLQPVTLMENSIPTGKQFQSGNRVLSRRRNTLWDDEEDDDF